MIVYSPIGSEDGDATIMLIASDVGKRFSGFIDSVTYMYMCAQSQGHAAEREERIAVPGSLVATAYKTIKAAHRSESRDAGQQRGCPIASMLGRCLGLRSTARKVVTLCRYSMSRV